MDEEAHARPPGRLQHLLHRLSGLPPCGGAGVLVLMAFVTDPEVTRAILEHLRLPATAPPQAPARGPPQSEFAGWDQSGAVE